MEIVMLGHSGAGKTTYMSLMYEMMDAGVDGFTVGAADPADHRRLLAGAQAVRRSRYPDPSDQRNSYALQLAHDGSSMLDFAWKDYRGGALTERSTSDQKQELHHDLLTADGIVVFVDLHDLLTNAKSLRKTRFLTVLVTEALSERNSLTPLVIAATKVDLVSPSADPTPFHAAFEAIITAVAATTHVHGTFVELSCGPRPVNVHGPVLFCLALGLHARLDQLRSELESTLRLATEAASRDTLWDRVSSRLQGEPTWRSIAADRYSRALVEYQALAPLVGPSEQLLKQVSQLPHF